MSRMNQTALQKHIRFLHSQFVEMRRVIRRMKKDDAPEVKIKEEETLANIKTELDAAKKNLDQMTTADEEPTAIGKGNRAADGQRPLIFLQVIARYAILPSIDQEVRRSLKYD